MLRVASVLLWFASLPAFAGPGNTGAICIAFDIHSAAERVAYAAFGAYTCGLYRDRVVLTNPVHAANEALAPKRARKVESLLQRVPQVDLFIFGHTNGADDWFRARFAEQFQGKLRLVYNSGCNDGSAAAAGRWLRSARVFVGHPGENWGETYTPAFVWHWLSGKSAAESAQAANKKLSDAKFFAGANDPLGYVHGDGSIRVDTPAQTR